MGLKSGFGHFFSEKQLPYLENCKTISHIMIVMTVNSAFYYITGSLACDRIRSQPWSLNMEEIQMFLAWAYNHKSVWSLK